jgi:hypothetical protein
MASLTGQLQRGDLTLTLQRHLGHSVNRSKVIDPSSDRSGRYDDWGMTILFIIVIRQWTFVLRFNRFGGLHNLSRLQLLRHHLLEIGKLGVFKDVESDWRVHLRRLLLRNGRLGGVRGLRGRGNNIVLSLKR